MDTEPTNADLVSNEFFRNAAYRGVAEHRSHYGDRLVAMYVCGSVHRDEAIPGVSDLDLIAFTSDGFNDADKQWRHETNDNLQMEFPGLGKWTVPFAASIGDVFPPDIQFDSEQNITKLDEALEGMLHGVRMDTEARVLFGARSLCDMLQRDTTLLWGRNIADSLSVPCSNRLWAQVQFQSPWDLVRYTAGLEPKHVTAYAKAYVTEYKLPDEPQQRVRKLARLAVLGGAYLLMAREEFRSFKSATVLPQLIHHYPRWATFLNETSQLSVNITDYSTSEMSAYLTQLVAWMDWAGEQFNRP